MSWTPPLDPADPRAPKYWMHETGGALAIAVRRYLNAPENIDAHDIALLRAYLVQWIASPAWTMNPHADQEQRTRLAALSTAARAIRTLADVRRVIAAATAEGMDPL